jgi:hypothetical protein
VEALGAYDQVVVQLRFRRREQDAEKNHP